MRAEHNIKSRHSTWWRGVTIVKVFLFLGISIGIGMGFGLWYRSPCRITVDCRGNRIDSSTLSQMREQEKEGYLGVQAITGWRTEPDAPVTCALTGQTDTAKVLAVDGPMELVFPAKILSGTYGLATGDDYCVLTDVLAYRLFGSTTAGEQIFYDGRRLTVAGVIEKDEAYLLVPTDKGMMESLAVRFRMRSKWREKIEKMLENNA